MKKVLVIVLALVMCLSAFAVASAEEVKGDINGDGILKIGFSELDIDGAWRITQVESMEEEAAARGYDYMMTNAEYDTEKQVADVEDLLAQDVDFLFIAPIDMDAIVPALSAAKEAGVPVILLDREATGTWGEDWLTTIIADYVQQGEMCGQWLVDNMGDEEVKIVEITGVVGGSDVRDRAQGIRNIVDQHDNMSIVATQTGEWSRSTAQEVMENIIQSTGGDFNVVYCHNDEMALGAVLALKAAGMNPGTDVKVIAIDGQAEAVEAIIAGEMNAIATCSPRFGKAAFDALEKYLAGETFEQYIINTETLITIDNAEEQLPLAF
ncbi:MAG: ABC transporter substrate-binding protein [Eubacteriales bacterium]|nr:ABC transporter substrate-binding protein [Eubacteriales bacterium]